MEDPGGDYRKNKGYGNFLGRLEFKRKESMDDEELKKLLQLYRSWWILVGIPRGLQQAYLPGEEQKDSIYQAAKNIMREKRLALQTKRTERARRFAQEREDKKEKERVQRLALQNKRKERAKRFAPQPRKERLAPINKVAQVWERAKQRRSDTIRRKQREQRFAKQKAAREERID